MSRGAELMREMATRGAGRRAWEEANPEISAAWNDAWEEDERRREQKRVEAEKAARAASVREAAPRRLVAMGAPQRAVDLWASGEGKPTVASRAIERMGAENLPFALLAGDTGVGKTCAAVAYLARVLLEDVRSEQPVLFVRATEGARLGLYDAEDKKLAWQMRVADALVLDDLGTEFLSDGSIWRTILDEVIDYRYAERLATIITTNLTTEAFKARYGARIADRLRHAGVIESCGTGSLRTRGEG